MTRICHLRFRVFIIPSVIGSDHGQDAGEGVGEVTGDRDFPNRVQIESSTKQSPKKRPLATSLDKISLAGYLYLSGEHEYGFQ
jgi:hypothetical protein